MKVHMKRRFAFCGSLAMVLFLKPGVSHARWLNASTGRFLTADTFEGNKEDPNSLHKYLYCYADPITCVHPSGGDIGEVAIVGIGNPPGQFPIAFNKAADSPPNKKRMKRFLRVGSLTLYSFILGSGAQ